MQTTKSAILTTPLGSVLVCAQEVSLCGLWFLDQKYFPKQSQAWEKDQNFDLFKKVQRWLDAYFAGTAPIVDFDVQPKGTPFQTLVWQALARIPYGQTTTYGEIAKGVAKSMNRPSVSAQAVGGAVGHNPVSIIVPCHRVLGSTGALTGFAGGLARKQALLAIEKTQK